MFDREQIQTKNVKKYYVPKTAVIYFSESCLTVSNSLSKLIVEYTKFIQIGSQDIEFDAYAELPINKNRYNKEFFSWNETIKGETRIAKPATFFNHGAGRKVVEELKNYDLVIVVFKSNKLNSLIYVNYLMELLRQHDVFSFHFVIESFVHAIKTQKVYKKLIHKMQVLQQIFVPIGEEAVVNAYKQATISNRNYYINLYTNDLIESFLSPFLDPAKNPDQFPKIKALFYQDQRNFESQVVTTIGYSSARGDYLDLALIQALANPIFYGAFNASNTFLINIKTPFSTPNMRERMLYILEHVVGSKKTFILSSYIGSYNYDVYCQVSIMAINVDQSRLMSDHQAIDQHLKTILHQVSQSHEIFKDEEIRLMILNQNIEILEDHHAVDELVNSQQK